MPGELRALFFCNEQLGLGHARRALTLASALVRRHPATALVVTGAPALPRLRLPAGVHTMRLPAAPIDGHTRWRDGGPPAAPGAGLASHEVRALRARLSLAAAEQLRPHVAVVDYKPLGRAGELVPALRRLRAQGARAVLGLREVDDAPGRVRSEWSGRDVERLADLYDLALVYGAEVADDPRVERLRAAGIPVRHVGVVAPPPAQRGPPDLPRGGYLLATAGGGADGFELLAAVAAAARSRPLPLPAVLVAGPVMPVADVARLRRAAAGVDIRVEASRPDMEVLLAGARAVVAMAGYATVAEILAARVPALLVPRAAPREEQLLRARRLAAAGRVAILERRELSPARLRSELERLLSAARPPAPQAGELAGAERAAAALAAIAHSSRDGDGGGSRLARGGAAGARA